MKQTSYTPLYLAIAVVLGIILGTFLNFQKQSISLFSANSKEAKVKRLIDYIQYDYVEKVDTDSLLDGAIKQMLLKLDPHSVYIPKENLQKVTENMQGKFVGIGVQFTVHKDTLTVTQIIEDGPSERAGIKAGDRILIANKDTLFGKKMTSEAIIKVLKGKPNTKVNLLVYRKRTKKTINIPVVRGEVKIKSVPTYFMLNSDLGYIKIVRFARTTYDEFKEGLDKLLSKGMKTLVLDLRDNPGGFIDIAEKITDEFLEDDKLIVFTKNKGGKIDKSFATKKGDFENGKLYVLIDENSASASEIVVGALQDNDKGTIVGRRSFGKGLVQQEMELGDGSAIRLTTARYYTPTGRSIQKPYGKSKNAYYHEKFDRFANGELTSADSIKVIDSLQFKTPKGKIVYGGGGIIPDIFVPLDTTNYFNNIHVRRLNDFTFNYVDNHRLQLDTMSVKTFIRTFDKEDEVLNIYLKATPSDKKANKEALKLYLKAVIADKVFGDKGFYLTMQLKDNMIQKVIALENN